MIKAWPTGPIEATLSEPDVRWQQRFSNDCRALEQLEGFFEPPDLNAREEQGLIKALAVPDIGENRSRIPFHKPRLSAMSALLKNIQEQARSLSAEERAMLAESMLASLHKPINDIEATWAEEVKDRVRAFIVARLLLTRPKKFLPKHIEICSEACTLCCSC